MEYNDNSIIDFGKYKGYKAIDVFKNDINYAVWCIKQDKSRPSPKLKHLIIYFKMKINTADYLMKLKGLCMMCWNEGYIYIGGGGETPSNKYKACDCCDKL